jgi:PncC family amidohydrolase
MYKEENSVNNISRKELLSELFSLIQRENLTVSTAESCTGGLIAGAITSLPGISSYYKEGFVTYSNEAKKKYLNVPNHTLEKHGAVSHQTAFHMVHGLIKNTGADVGVAIGAGTDVAVDAADIVLVKSDLESVCDMIHTGRKTLRNIHENLFWAFIYNIIGIPLAAGVWIPIFGWELNPMFGAAAMSLSSFCVVMNALRLNLIKFNRH